MDALLIFLGVVGVGAGVALTLPDGRVPCPQCGEAIMPTARRCPFCRSVVIDRI